MGVEIGQEGVHLPGRVVCVCARSCASVCVFGGGGEGQGGGGGWWAGGGDDEGLRAGNARPGGGEQEEIGEDRRLEEEGSSVTVYVCTRVSVRACLRVPV